MKTVYIIVTSIAGKSKYIAATTTRNYDKKKIITLLEEDPDKAKDWDTAAEAASYLGQCIVNDRQYQVIPHQVKNKKEKPVVFSEKALKAML